MILTLIFLVDLKIAKFISFHVQAVAMSHLTVVTNTSQISSSGKEMAGGRLDKKS